MMRSQRQLHDHVQDEANAKFAVLSPKEQQIAAKLANRIDHGLQEKSLDGYSDGIREYYYSAFAVARLKATLRADSNAAFNNLAFDILSLKGANGVLRHIGSTSGTGGQTLGFATSLSMQSVMVFLFSTPLLLSRYCPNQYASFCQWQMRGISRLARFLDSCRSKRAV